MTTIPEKKSEFVFIFGFMIVVEVEPANSSPTTCLSMSSTAEPESPPALMAPAISWFLKTAIRVPP